MTGVSARPDATVAVDARSGDRREILVVATLALIAAAPSIAWALVGWPLTDDWAIWATFESRGLTDGLIYNAFTAPGRPGAGVLYAVLYGMVGPNPFVHGLILASLNVGLVFAAWFLGRRLLPAPVLFAVLVVLALAPNHATTRLWPATTTHVLALTVSFLAVGMLVRGRPVVAAVLLCTSTLLHEGGIALGAMMVLLWGWQQPRAQWRTCLLVVAPASAAALAMALNSPKRGASGPAPLNNIESFVPGQLGVGLWSHGLLSRVAVFVFVGFVAVAVVTRLPSFRSDRSEYRFILIGVLLAAAGALPYTYLGTTFATTGLFDRSNLMPSVGVAIVLASAWSLIARRAPRLSVAIALLTVTGFARGQVEDVRAFADAGSHGEDVVDALVAMPIDPTQPAVVLDARDPRGSGVAAFVYDGDLAAALLYRTGDSWEVALGENLKCGSSLRSAPVQVVDWRTRQLEEVGPEAFDRSCEDWRDL